MDRALLNIEVRCQLRLADRFETEYCSPGVWLVHSTTKKPRHWIAHRMPTGFRFIELTAQLHKKNLS